jgi:hypothetical protein
MVLANPPNAKTNGAVFVHLQVVGRAYWRGFVLVAQLLFGQVPKLFVPTFRLSRLLPQFVRAASDFFFSWLLHALHLRKPARYAEAPSGA